MVKKISDLYLDTRRVLLDTEDQQSASLIARNILCRFTGKTQEQILADRDKYVSDETCAAVEGAITRILEGEPLAYVLEEWDFYGMRLYVNSNVLIPRDDTCAVTTLAIEKALFLDKDPRILDLCTGSGCIGLALDIRFHIVDGRGEYLLGLDLHHSVLQDVSKDTCNQIGNHNA